MFVCKLCYYSNPPFPILFLADNTSKIIFSFFSFSQLHLFLVMHYAFISCSSVYMSSSFIYSLVYSAHLIFRPISVSSSALSNLFFLSSFSLQLLFLPSSLSSPVHYIPSSFFAFSVSIPFGNQFPLTTYSFSCLVLGGFGSGYGSYFTLT